MQHFDKVKPHWHLLSIQLLTRLQHLVSPKVSSVEAILNIAIKLRGLLTKHLGPVQHIFHTLQSCKDIDDVLSCPLSLFRKMISLNMT